jgi:ribosome-associated translation inhibitor RaiA
MEMSAPDHSQNSQGFLSVRLCYTLEPEWHANAAVAASGKKGDRSTMQVEIQAQNSDVHPRWQTIIQRRAGKLTGHCRDIIRLHVTLVHSTHHLCGNEEVRLLAAVPNDTLRVHKARANMGDAIHAAFVALERELQAWVDRRKHVSKQVTPRAAAVAGRGRLRPV